MKFLADENLPELTLDLLRKQEVDILSVLSVGTGLKDRDVLRIANEQGRLLVTFDKDFGDLVFSAGMQTKGVILLRFRPTSPEQVAHKLKALLDSGVELEGNFVVLGDEGIRVTPVRR
jgi:predicted nuclease of predicted toxin-antitoxin system